LKNGIDRKQLAPFSLFSEFSDEQLDVVAKVMRMRRYNAGNTIIREGEIGGELFVLLSGEIEISKTLTMQATEDSAKREKSLLRLSADSHVFFGEMSLFGSDERSATVNALTEVVLGVLTRERVSYLIGSDPQLGYLLFYNIGQKLAENLRRANRDILKLTTAFCLALEGR